MENREIKLGKYKHFKGHICNVIGVARYSEDENQEFVVYEHEKDEHMQLWIRPKDMFLEEVEKDGKKVLRFEYIS